MTITFAIWHSRTSSRQLTVLWIWGSTCRNDLTIIGQAVLQINSFDSFDTVQLPADRCNSMHEPVNDRQGFTAAATINSNISLEHTHMLKIFLDLLMIN